MYFSLLAPYEFFTMSSMSFSTAVVLSVLFGSAALAMPLGNDQSNPPTGIKSDLSKVGFPFFTTTQGMTISLQPMAQTNSPPSSKLQVPGSVNPSSQTPANLPGKLSPSSENPAKPKLPGKLASDKLSALPKSGRLHGVSKIPIHRKKTSLHQGDRNALTRPRYPHRHRGHSSLTGKKPTRGRKILNKHANLKDTDDKPSKVCCLLPF